MSDMTADTLVNEWTWKTDSMRAMAVAVLRLAVSRAAGEPFSALDLPIHGEDAHGGSGIAGSVFRQLADAHILAPVGVFCEGEFLQRRVRNAGGNPVGLWRLADWPLAHALLRRHGAAQERQEQRELAI